MTVNLDLPRIYDLLEASGEFQAEVVEQAIKTAQSHPEFSPLQAMKVAFKQIFANAPEMWVYAEE